MSLYILDTDALQLFQLRIAATVLERSAILITRNSRVFRKVPGLQIEDWSV